MADGQTTHKQPVARRQRGDAVSGHSTLALLAAKDSVFKHPPGLVVGRALTTAHCP